MVTLSTRKVQAIALFALILALFAFVYVSSLELNESIFQIEVNNTNLAPNSTDSVGTGERIQGTTYYANETPIDIYVWAHAQSPGDTAEVHLYINGTKLQDQSDKVIGVAEQLNNSVTGRIPKYASYKIEVNNFHHYEWREYRVISGQNGSVSLTTNYYNTTVGGADNASLNLKVNKSGDTMTGALNMSNNYIYNPTAIESNNQQLLLNSFFGVNSLVHIQSNGNTIDITDTETTFSNDIDMNGNNVLNCANCINTTNLNTKVNKSGDNMDVNAKLIFSSDNASANNNLIESYNNGSLRTKLTTMGTQYWYVNGSDVSPDTPYGLIAYVNPFAAIGIAFLNATNGHRTDIRSTSAGIEMWVGTTGSLGSMTTNLQLQRNNTIQTSALTGVGNAYVCVYPNGTLFRGSPGC